MKKIIIFSIFVCLQFNVKGQKVILKEVIEEAIEKNTSKASKIASQNLEKEVAETALKYSQKRFTNPKYYTSTYNRKFVNTSKLNSSDFEKILTRRDFTWKYTKNILAKIRTTELRNIYSKVDQTLTTEQQHIVLQDFIENRAFFNSISKSQNKLNAYYDLLSLGRKYRTDIKLINQRSTGSSYLKLTTINDRNSIVNGIKFIKKRIQLPNNIMIEGKFPVFKSIIDVKLPDHRILSTDIKQMNYAFLKFQKQLKYDIKLQNKFTPETVKELLSRKLTSNKISINKVPGHTWHHSEDIGVLQLVETSIHKKTSHTGGKAIWGGGKQYR